MSPIFGVGAALQRDRLDPDQVGVAQHRRDIALEDERVAAGAAVGDVAGASAPRRNRGRRCRRRRARVVAAVLEQQEVVAGAAVDGVVAGAAVQPVGDRIAGQGVVAAAAGGILDGDSVGDGEAAVDAGGVGHPSGAAIFIVERRGAQIDIGVPGAVIDDLIDPSGIPDRRIIGALAHIIAVAGRRLIGGVVHGRLPGRGIDIDRPTRSRPSGHRCRCRWPNPR